MVEELYFGGYNPASVTRLRKTSSCVRCNRKYVIGMNRPLVALFLMFLFGALATAQGQTTPNAPRVESCPTLSITGPAGVTVPGELMDMTAEVSGAPPNVAYHWTLEDEGVIEGGQGTLRLRVRAPKKTSFNIVATLEIKGLPPGCVNKISETAPVSCRCLAILAEYYPALNRREEIARLDAVVNQLLNDQKLYIIQYFPARASEAKRAKRVKWLTDFFTKTKQIPPEQLEIVSSELVEPEVHTKLYLVPPGVENPSP